MLVFVSFEFTIVVDSVFFSWDLGPRTSCVRFSLAAITIFVKQHCCGKKSQNKARSGVVSFFLMMIESLQIEHLMLLF